MKKYIIIVAMIGIMMIGFQQTAFSQMLVPEWVRNTATWYGQGLVSEREFLDAVKYLIENKIIVMEEKPSDSKSSQQITQTDQSQVIVTKPRLNFCMMLNQSYKELGDVKFKSKYSQINYLNECIKLYKDPLWKYKGDDRIDVLYKRFLELREEAKETRAKLSTEPHVQVRSKIDLGNQNFRVLFNVCAGDLPIDKAKILIQSEIEAIQVGTSKDVPANACRSYETQIYAKHADNIKLSIIEQVLDS